MKIALVLASKYNFTAVAIDKRKHSRPAAPFNNTAVVYRRSYVLGAQIVRVYGRGSTWMTVVQPIRTFLYCQQRRKWAVRGSGDALAFISRFDGWTWLGITVEFAVIGFVRTKLLGRGNSIIILLALLTSQGQGNGL